MIAQIWPQIGQHVGRSPILVELCSTFTMAGINVF